MLKLGNLSAAAPLRATPKPRKTDPDALLDALRLATAVPPDGLLKAREAQALLRVGHSKFYDLVNTGAFPVIRIGRSVHVSKRVLTAFIEKCTSGGWNADA